MIISSALRPSRPGAGGDPGCIGMLPIILMFVLLYFLMIRPQMKRAKEHKAMIEALQKGDEVITAGGVLGRITKISDDYVTLEIAPNTRDPGAAAAVQMLLPKGTIKTLQVAVNRYPIWKLRPHRAARSSPRSSTRCRTSSASRRRCRSRSGKATVKADAALLARVEETLKKASIPSTGVLLDADQRARALRRHRHAAEGASDVIDQALNPDPDDPTTSSR